MYRVEMKEINQTIEFNNYKEARKWLTETRKNWEDQIDNDFDNPEDKKRILLIELYWNTKIVRGE